MVHDINIKIIDLKSILGNTVKHSFNSFSGCCDTVPWQKQLNGERAYFGSQFKVILHHSRDTIAAGGEAFDYITFTVNSRES